MVSAVPRADEALRPSSVTISRGSSENIIHGAEDRGCRRCRLLHRRGVAAFHQACTLLEDHATLYSVAGGDGADKRRVRDPRRLGVAGPRNAQGSGLGTRSVTA
jgi:hypothetical protein